MFLYIRLLRYLEKDVSLPVFYLEKVVGIENSLSPTNLKFSIYSVKSLSIFHKLDSNIF